MSNINARKNGITDALEHRDNTLEQMKLIQFLSVHGVDCRSQRRVGHSQMCGIPVVRQVNVSR